jgi:molybdenum cofactor cytidylyltransferase
LYKNSQNPSFYDYSTNFVLKKKDISMHSQIPIIILAAGSSSRLGQPKQLLQCQGQTLLNRTISLSSEVSNNISVVLGANYPLIASSITNTNCKIIINEFWEIGMSTSIQKGLQNNLDADKVIITLCDQPYLSANILRRLIDSANQTELPIIASNYGNKIGVPILFKKLIFNDLMSLKGEKGARAILPKYTGFIAEIPFPKGEIDIDTIEDWQLFLKNADK